MNQRLVIAIVVGVLLVVAVIGLRKSVSNWIAGQRDVVTVANEKDKPDAEEIKKQVERSLNRPIDPELGDRIKAADLSVLFIGNSHTYYPDIAKITEQLVQSQNPNMKLCFVSRAQGGMTLTGHLKTTKTLDLIAAGPWDYIVLQGPRHRSTTEGAKRIANLDSISKETRILLYSVWGTKRRIENAKPIYQDLVNTAKSIDAGVVPVGLAWQACYESQSDYPLYAADGNHSTFVGGYLTSCVFYSYLTKKPCTELNNVALEKAPTELTEDIRDSLEKFAWAAYEKHAVDPPAKQDASVKD